MTGELDSSQEISRYLTMWEASALLVSFVNIVCILTAWNTSEANLLIVIEKYFSAIGLLGLAGMIVANIIKSEFPYSVTIAAFYTILLTLTSVPNGFWIAITMSCLLVSISIVSVVKKILNSSFYSSSQ